MRRLYVVEKIQKKPGETAIERLIDTGREFTDDAACAKAMAEKPKEFPDKLYELHTNGKVKSRIRRFEPDRQMRVKFTDVGINEANDAG